MGKEAGGLPGWAPALLLPSWTDRHISNISTHWVFNEKKNQEEEISSPFSPHFLPLFSLSLKEMSLLNQEKFE